jgi:hypothetical protein
MSSSDPSSSTLLHDEKPTYPLALKPQDLLALRPISAAHTVALAAATRAIAEAETEITTAHALAAALTTYLYTYSREKVDVSTFTIQQKNTMLASLIREVANAHGWLAGWQCLASVCPDCNMHPVLLEDGTSQSFFASLTDGGACIYTADRLKLFSSLGLHPPSPRLSSAPPIQLASFRCVLGTSVGVAIHYITRSFTTLLMLQRISPFGHHKSLHFFFRNGVLR